MLFAFAFVFVFFFVFVFGFVLVAVFAFLCVSGVVVVVALVLILVLFCLAFSTLFYPTMLQVQDQDNTEPKISNQRSILVRLTNSKTLCSHFTSIRVKMSLSTSVEEMASSSTIFSAKKDYAEFECSICLNLMCEPLLLACGHHFCRLCLVQSHRLSVNGRYDSQHNKTARKL